MPIRKNTRLKDFDYSQNAIYHITICTADKTNILGKVHAEKDGTACVGLSDVGFIVNEAVKNIHLHYENITVVNYVIMPNHIHLLLQIDSISGQKNSARSISTVIMQLKRIVSIKAGKSIWQKGFYDHIIRNEIDFEEIYKYIQNNPQKWLDNSANGF